MNYKKILAGLFVLTLFASLVLAVTLTVSPSSVTLTKSRNATVVLGLAGNGTQNIDILIPNPIPISSEGRTVTVDFVEVSQPVNGLNVILLGDVADFPFGIYSVTGEFEAVNSSNPSQVLSTANLTIDFKSGFCDFGEIGSNLSITSVDINSNGDEDDEWAPLDEVEVEVDVDNIGDNDLDEITVELALFDSEGNDVTDDLEFTNRGDEKIDLGGIDEGEDDTATFTFKVTPELQDGSNYRLAVKVYSEDVGEDEICDDSSGDLSNEIYQRISINKEEDDEKRIIVDEISVPESVTCGDPVAGTFTVFNIGSEDEDQVKVEMVNTQLGLNQAFTFRNLDEGDEASSDFVFDVPANVKDGTYKLELRTFYEYDEDSDFYEERSDRTFTANLKVIGCGLGGPSGSADISIGADLEGDAKAGEEMRVLATITNTGDDKIIVSVDADGYQDWADLESISRKSLTLESGESEEVTLVFTVNEDASGTQTFTIQTMANDQIETQEVEVNLEDATSGGFQFGENSRIIWIIGIINLVLIILIIIVAVKLAQK